VAHQPQWGPGRPNVEVSRSHTDTQSVGLLWTSDQPRRRDRYIHNTQAT